MPKRYRAKRPRRARKARQRRRNPGTNIPRKRLGGMIPDRTRITLKYAVAPLAISTDSSVLNTYLFNLNSVYDPDRTGTGHQPFGFDQMATFYSKYCVVGCKWQVVFANNAVGTSQSHYVGCCPLNFSTTPTGGLSEYMEQKRNRYAISDFHKKPVIVGSVKLPKLLGAVNDTAYIADDLHYAFVSASPTDVCCLHVYSLAVGGQATEIVYASVILWYDVVFMEPRNMGQS